MSSPETDLVHMRRALELAGKASCSADPNPAVGCVIVKGEQVIGEGFTQRPGGNHAEIEALAAAGTRAQGATVYVTLEPCAHTGRTGPCADALISAQVATVVYALDDPDPRVQGRGAARLAAAGIEVRSGPLAAESEQLNCGFVSRMRRGRPWVRCKMAASLDGRTALANGQSQWITGEAARRDVHHWRARSSAVLTGIGTLLADDPKLTARVDDPAIDTEQPLRVVLDSHLRTPADAALLREAGQALIVTASSAGAAAKAGADAGLADRASALQAAGAELEPIAHTDAGLDLAAVLARLGERELNSVWLEAGPTLAGAMLVANCIDEFVFYFAPDLFGASARGLFELPVLESLDARYRLVIDDVSQVGRDLRIVARPVSAGTGRE